MPINFDIIDTSGSKEAVEPQAIFRSLPERSDKYDYLRDVQDQVLGDWFKRRSERDLLIKMNTGGGKTVVGLLLLQSCINEGFGPAAYLTPDRYLAAQVCREADDLGIRTTDDPRSSEFESGSAILVATVAKLFNGKSVFGAGSQRLPIDLGSVLFDDAHSAVDIIEQQFTITVPKEHQIFRALLRLFEPDLKRQSMSGYLDIESGVSSALEVVPFWAWRENHERVARVLSESRDSEELRFSYDLIADSLLYSVCIFSGTELSIRPLLPPTAIIPSFDRCKRRVFMTATLADESTLVSHLGADADGVASPITPKSASDLGERLILAPLELDPSISDDQLDEFVSNLAREVNVALICPSVRRSRRWSPIASSVVTAENLEAQVEEMRNGHVGLVVFVGKYDGVDLPGDACRVLVVDGVPEAVTLHDRHTMLGVGGTSLGTKRQIQRIEQGMGRGVRSENDYCAVLLLDARLTRYLSGRGSTLFSPATAAQLDLSRQIASQLEGGGLNAVLEAVEMVLTRNKDWIRTSKKALASVTYRPGESDMQDATNHRRAMDAASRGQYVEAAEILQRIANRQPDLILEGWMKRELAIVTDLFDPVAAQEIQIAANRMNPYTTRPKVGVAHQRLSPTARSQAERLRDMFVQQEESQILLAYREMTADLSYGPASASRFEACVADLGRLLGFDSCRPEKSEGRGPDNLWSLGGDKYLVIECKSEATNGFVSKTDANQLGGSMNWFAVEYDSCSSAIPLLMHPSSSFDSAASAPQDTRVITGEQLGRLRSTVNDFARSASKSLRRGDLDGIAARLAEHKLTAAAFAREFGTLPRTRSQG